MRPYNPDALRLFHDDYKGFLSQVCCVDVDTERSSAVP
jgi:hypothetical protein